MKLFCTRLRAIDPQTGELCTWSGPIIQAINWKHAELLIEDRGYLTIDGELIAEIDSNGIDRIDYDIISQN